MRNLLLGALALWASAACHRGGAPGVLRLGFFPNLTHAQALVGARDGTFRRALGGRLETKQFTAGPSAMEALLAGSLDACYVGSGPAITAYVRAPGALHVIAGSASGGTGFVVHGVQRPEELLGKRVASPGLGNSQDVALRHWLRTRGMAISSVCCPKDAVTVTPLSNADILGLFKRGEVAGAWVPEPWVARLVHEAGGRLFIDERSLWPKGELPTTVLVASREALLYRREQLKALVSAHVRITMRARGEPAAFAAEANAAYGALTSHPLAPPVLQDALRRIDFSVDPLEPELYMAAEHARALGFIPSSNIQGLVDGSLLREVTGGSGS